MNQTYNLVELFSGIGSQLKALNNIGVQTNVLNICEWDIHAFTAYDAIHNGNQIQENIGDKSKEELLELLSKYNLSNNGKEAMQYKILRSYSLEALKKIYSAIIKCNNIVDIQTLKGSKFDKSIDILTYSFPCQDLSNVGAFHGYNKGIEIGSGSRSSLLWQVGRVLEEMDECGYILPRFLILENVPALLAKRHKENFDKWKNKLLGMGYHNKLYVINASNYGIPQNRPRLIMISTLLPQNNEKKGKMIFELDKYYKNHDLADLEYISKLNIEPLSIDDLIKTDYNNPKLFEEAVESQPNDTTSRRTIWKENPKLIDENGTMAFDTIRTITTKQDRNPNSGNIYFDYENNTKSKFRYLTPRECFLFMGFSEEDFEKLIKENPDVHKNYKLFTRDKLIRMAGNSIPVKLLEQVFKQVIEIDKEIGMKIKN